MSKKNNSMQITFGVVAVMILVVASVLFISRMDTGQKPGGAQTSKLVPVVDQDPASNYQIKLIGNVYWLSGTRITRAAFKEIAASSNQPFTLLLANDPKDVDWEGLLELKSRPMETLVVQHTTFGDNECAVVSTFPYLRKLDMTATDVSDLGIDRVCDSKYINGFCIAGTKTTIACLKSFLKLPQLSSLECDGMPGFGLAELQFLCQFKNLTKLSISHIRVGDNGMRIIAKMPALRELLVCGCDITDQGIKNLAGSKVKGLVIMQNTGITDRCIPYLQKLPNLVFLQLGHSTNITADAEQRLRKEMPALAIEHEGGFGATVKGNDVTNEAMDGIKLLAPSLDAPNDL